LVASAATNKGVWAFAGGLVVAGVLLFQTMESRRANVGAPSIARTASENGQFVTAPELDIPHDYAGEAPNDRYAAFLPSRSFQPQFNQPPSSRPAVPPQIVARTVRPAPPALEGSPGLGSLPAYRPPASPSAFGSPDTGSLPRPASTDIAGDQERSKERVQATRFANPATTVPKGTVMQAVLETALDSTRPGFARAIISRDVHGFDGSSVLVPRGSRLIGEYKADVAAGQKRALIQWQRLMRPDGVVINLDSPSADPLGRAGVGGKVNSHFFERFAGSILQSTLDIGVQLATRHISRDTYILALPGSTQGLIANGAEKIQPTVTVRQGASVSVFVARDLDFTSVGP
jgi:type IV secretion system protein VirB10